MDSGYDDVSGDIFDYSSLTTSLPFETRNGTKVAAFDFDNTFNAEPFIFAPFVGALQKAGWYCCFVTFRFPEQDSCDIQMWAEKLGMDIFYTSGIQKAAYMATMGIFPDIWIDDNPAGIPAKNQLEFARDEVVYKRKAKKNNWPLIIEDYPDPEAEPEEYLHEK